MRKSITLKILLLIVIFGSFFTYKFRHKISQYKRYYNKTELFQNSKITNPLNDRIPKTKSEVVFGLDLSHHQHPIKWEKIKQHPPNFIIFKTTEGSTHVDNRYKNNITIARKKGIIVGGYHFFSYNSSGKNQAINFVNNSNLQKGDIIPVLDVEFTKNMESDLWIKKNISDFIFTINDELGVKPIIYCEIAYYNRFIKPEFGDELFLWLSDFSRKPENHFVLWQKTNKYKQIGIKGTVDYNIFNGNKTDLLSICLK